MEEITFNQLISSIDSNIKYWMVRTMGGDYYEEYVQEGYVAIGYNEILLQDLTNLPENEKISRNILHTLLDARMPDRSNNNYPSAQLYRFYREMSIGDYIIVPSRSSFKVAIGVISSDVYETFDAIHYVDQCKFSKRRKVEWKEQKMRNKLNPSLQLMFNSRHIISNVDDYAPFIDGLVNDFYIKDDKANLIIKIDKEDDVSAEEFHAIYKIFDIVNLFCKLQGFEVNTSDLILKIQMQSPGEIRLTSKHKLVIILVGLAILSINGGGLKINMTGFKLDLSTTGILRQYSEYLDRDTDREVKASIKSKLDSLQIESPEDLEPIIKLLHEQNQLREQF